MGDRGMSCRHSPKTSSQECSCQRYDCIGDFESVKLTVPTIGIRNACRHEDRLGSRGSRLHGCEIKGHDLPHPPIAFSGVRARSRGPVTHSRCSRRSGRSARALCTSTAAGLAVAAARTTSSCCRSVAVGKRGVMPTMVGPEACSTRSRHSGSGRHDVQPEALAASSMLRTSIRRRRTRPWAWLLQRPQGLCPGQPR